MRLGPLSDAQAGEYIGRSASWVTRSPAGYVPRATSCSPERTW